MEGRMVTVDKYTAHETGIYRNLKIQIVRETENSVTILSRPALSTLSFYENIWTSNYLKTQHFEIGCVFVTQLSTDVGISAGRIVGLTTNCSFISDMVINILLVNDMVISLEAKYNTFSAGVIYPLILFCDLGTRALSQYSK